MHSTHRLLTLALPFLLLASGLLVTGCDDDPTSHDHDHEGKGTLLLRFAPTFDGAPLTAGTKYITLGGDTIELTTLKFYASEFDLTPMSHGGSGSSTVPVRVETIGLIDLFGDDAARTISLKVDAQHYTGATFSVGVPESENHKDAATQSEPLGPNTGMYWGWDPGYIFFKVEGFVDSSGSALPFVYHCGEDSRKKRIDLVPTSHAVVAEDGEATLTIEVALDRFFAVGTTQGQPLRLRNDPSARRHHKGPADLADLTAGNFAMTFLAQ